MIILCGIGILLILIGCYVIWQRCELKKFNITYYNCDTDKLAGSIQAAVIADLHGHLYGERNCKLIDRLRKEQPDIILVPGDMIVSKYPETYPIALETFAELVQIAPVYFANGNHESRMAYTSPERKQGFDDYMELVKDLGVHILNNQSEVIEVCGQTIHIHGLEIPIECYGKGKYEPLPEDYIEQVLGCCHTNNYNIMLAHNPMFGKLYAQWGADVTVCGHTHGGLIRIPILERSVISPQFELFPAYDVGEAEYFGNKVYVSKGLGTHTFHIRIFDRAEVVMIRINH